MLGLQWQLLACCVRLGLQWQLLACCVRTAVAVAGMLFVCFIQQLACCFFICSHGTRLRNAEKNVGVALYAFNALQVFTLPPLYRPPDGTYKKLQT